MMSGYPTPWIVGPFGDIWVAADVEFRDGKWHETVSDPRLVVTLGGKSRSLAEQIVSAVNAAAKQPVCTEDDGTGDPVYPAQLAPEKNETVNEYVSDNGQFGAGA